MVLFIQFSVIFVFMLISKIHSLVFQNPLRQYISFSKRLKYYTENHINIYIKTVNHFQTMAIFMIHRNHIFIELFFLHSVVKFFCKSSVIILM